MTVENISSCILWPSIPVVYPSSLYVCLYPGLPAVYVYEGSKNQKIEISTNYLRTILIIFIIVAFVPTFKQIYVYIF